MNTIRKLALNLTIAGTVSVLAVMDPALAQGFPKEGSYDFTACLAGTSSLIAFSKTQAGYSYEATGTTRSNPPGGMMDNTSVRCVGLTTTLDGKRTQNTLCETVDRDGDKQLASLTMASDGKVTREVVSGTGKFEGLQMSGVVMPLGPFPTIKPGTFQTCNRQTGTYKMK